MSLPPQKFREIVFQLLFSSDYGDLDEELNLKLMMNELKVSKRSVSSALERVHAICEKSPEIDNLISSIATSYDLERIQSVTKNILRLAAYELLYDPLVPPKVVIAEAIRLSHKFATPESASFVNAILDKIKEYNEKL